MIPNPSPVHDGLSPPPPGYGEVFRFTLPLMAGMFTSGVHTLVDTAFVGRLGTHPLAAIGVAALYYFAGMVLFLGVMRNSMAFIARQAGAGRLERIGPIVAQYQWVALGAVPLMLGAALGFPLLARAGHFGPEVTSLGEAYLSYRVWEVFFFLLLVLYSSVYQSLGNSRFPMLVQWGTVGLNIWLDWLLIFGHGGLPAMGIGGSGLATVIAQGAGAVVMAGGLFFSVMRVRLGLVILARPDGALLKTILRVGLPQGLGDFVWVVAFTGFTAIVGRLGPQSLAASNIGVTVIHLLFLPAAAVGIGASSYVGRYLGMGAPQTARRAGLRALVLGMGYMGLMALPLWFFGEEIAGVFTADEKVIGLCGGLFKVLAVLEVFDGLDIIMRSALSGAGDTLVPLLVILAAVAGVMYPAAWVLSQRVDPGLIGAWLGLLAYLMVLGGVMFLRFHRGRWGEIRLKGTAE